MLAPNQLIEVKWGRTNCAHYKKLGYIFTKIGDSIMVKPEELLPNSKAIVKVICDVCGKITTTTYQSYLLSIKKNNNKYYCKSCVVNIPEVRNKREQTLLERYGDKNIFASEYFKEKSKETNLLKLGVEYPMQSSQVKEKSKNTFMEHDNLIGFQNKEILLKAQAALANSGKVLISSQQIELFNKLNNKYQCELNKPLESLNLDISLLYKDTYIDIEVDGEYWHKDANKDRKRDEFVKQHGYKILRIRINRKLPSIVEIEEAITALVSSEHSFYQIAAEDCKKNNNQ